MDELVSASAQLRFAVLVPAFNEAHTIRAVVIQALLHVDTVIVVAACATDICPALKASTKSSPARNQIRFSVAVFVIRYYSQGVVGTPIFYHVRPVGSAARQAVQAMHIRRTALLRIIKCHSRYS